MKKKLSSPDRSPQPVTRRVEEAALLAVPFMVLAFQIIRFEQFEAEKIGLLGILASVIAGSAFLAFIQRHRHQPIDWRKTLNNPLVLSAFALLAVAVLSTLSSLSFTRSLFGSSFRSQGLLALVFCIIFFWQAARLSAHGQTALTLNLIVITVPLAAFAIINHLTGDTFSLDAALRPRSTVGQPNYLSSWLVIALLYCGPQLTWRVVHWKHPFTAPQRAMIALWISVAALALYALILTSSRGALLGLCLGALLGVVIVASIRKNRRVLVGIAIIGIAAGAGYAAINSRLASPGPLIGVARIFQPYDEVRVTMWTNAALLVAHQADPLTAADGIPDRWAALRPILGYGLDTIEQTRTRAADISSAMVDRFHNLFFDVIGSLGWLGLMAWIAVYESAWFLGLRWLDLIHGDNWWQWLLAQGICIPLGVYFAVRIVPQGGLLPMAPVGSALGASIGSVAWIISRAFRRAQGDRIQFTQRHMLIVAILCIVMEQWIDNQFGFVQAATQPLWWIILGILVNVTREPGSQAAEPTASDASNPRGWHAGTLVAGLCLMHSLGITFQARPVVYETQSAPLFVLLIVLWLVGTLGALLDSTSHRLKAALYPALLIIVIWVVFFVIKQAIGTLSANSLDRALLTPGALSAESLRSAIQALSLSGIGVVLIAVVAFIGISGLRQLHRLAIVIASGCFLVGSIGYSWSYTGSALHGLGNLYSRTARLDTLTVSDVAYDAASNYLPTNTRIRLEKMGTLLSLAAASKDLPLRADLLTQIDEQAKNIFRWEPFLANSQEWHIFLSAYSYQLHQDFRLPGS